MHLFFHTQSRTHHCDKNGWNKRESVTDRGEGVREADRDKLYASACACAFAFACVSECVYFLLVGPVCIISSRPPLINNCTGLQGTFWPFPTAPF